mmetsp:Transcript_35972/g.75735  ORF Transcript_35972/g.75735 Transcript_35972/m.75735 type:complete len:1073 (+) Transcript_35972:267-3485(+)
MPGLQSIVSAWTKINNDHVQYFGEANGLHPKGPPQAGVPGGAPSALGGPQGPPQQGGGPSDRNPDGAAGGVIDPRAAATYANMPQPLPSSSSLSSYSFTKNGVVPSRDGTPDTTSLTATLTTAPPALMHNLAPPSTRYPLYHHGQPLAPRSSQSAAPSQQALHDASLLAAHGSSVRAHHRSSRRSHHHHHTLQGSHHHHGNLHSQLESYGSHSSLTNFDNNFPPPPPQAGADAILGRRKSNGLIDRTPSDVRGEPPASLSYANPPAKPSTNPTKGTLSKSPSTSLWHSTRSMSSNDSKKSSSNSAASVTASLEKMNANFPVVGTLRSSNVRGPSAATDAAIAELNASAENALQTMKNLSLKPQPPDGGRGANNGASHIHATPPTMTLPTPQRPTRSRFGRQKLKKSHSRSDLVREMALDRNNARKRGSTLTTSSSSTQPVRNAGSNIDEMDVSSSSMLSQQMNQSQQHGPKAQTQQQSQLGSNSLSPNANDRHQHQFLAPQQRPQRPSSPLSRRAMEENKGGGILRNADGNAQQQFPQGGSSSLGSSSLDEALRKQYNGINDTLIRNGPPGEHWMQDWFPNAPLPSNRRESSSGSSGTAITGNHSLASSLPLKQPPTAKNDSTNNNAGNLVTEKQPLPTTTAARNINTTAATLSLPPKQQTQIGANANGNSCDRCQQMEMTLLSLQTDLEYLRTLELQREFTVESDNASNAPTRIERMDSSLPPINQNTTYPTMSSERSVSSAVSIGSRGSRTSSRLVRRRSENGSMGKLGRTSTSRSLASRTSMFLRDASKRLSDLSTRHKRQVKQTTHERAYWQNDMHLKLEKFAMMCKNLNEEAAHRSNEVKETKALLDKMTSERNTLVSEVDTLKARVELYEDENVEQSRLREEWSKEKTQILDSMNSAIEERDAKIDDLSNRLGLAVETIENERKQQRMRRQIIFPSSRQSPSTNLERKDSDTSAPSSPHIRPNNMVLEPPKVDDLERIQRTKDAARKAQLSLQAAMVQSATREKEMQLRLDAMERELVEARATIASSNAGSGIGQEALVSLEREGRVGIRRISSTTSMGSVGALSY